MRKANATSLRSLLAGFSQFFAAALKLAAIRRNHFARRPALKALIAAAPLEGIELDRAGGDKRTQERDIAVARGLASNL